MPDARKFRLLIILTTVLTAVIISYNVLQESVIRDFSDSLQRRSYYEKVISKKGLSLHKGMYWNKKE